MSTNQTTNYGLHSWEPEDKFLREEINENFDLLDAALNLKATQSDLDTLSAGAVKVVSGRYNGGGTGSRSISLGFRPKVVLIMGRNNNAYTYAALLSDGTTDVNGGINANGFWVDGRLDIASNNSSFGGSEVNPYRYLAFRLNS